MKTVQDVCQFLDARFPPSLAEDWDNTGLLIGDPTASVLRVMTCLTISPDVISEAIEEKVELLVSHHPLPFQSVAQITTDSLVGRCIWSLAGAGISVYSPHTRFDSGKGGINESLCHRLKLQEVVPLVPADDETAGVGGGRIGRLDPPMAWPEWIDEVTTAFEVPSLRGVPRSAGSVHRIAIACGSGGSLLSAAIDQGCDVFVTGEANFHTCLECRTRGIGLVLLGHYRSERFGIERLAQLLSEQFSDLTIWPSRRETDPLSEI